MRICPHCDHKVNIRKETCPRCDSDLTGQAEVRRGLANRRTNKMLLGLTFGVCLIVASLATVVEPPKTTPPPPQVSEAPYVVDYGIEREQMSQFYREVLSVHSFLGTLSLENPYQVLNRVQAASRINPTYTILLRPDVYQFDQMYDLALDLAKNHPRQKVQVKFFTNLADTESSLPDYGFELKPDAAGWQMTYHHNI